MSSASKKTFSKLVPSNYFQKTSANGPIWTIHWGIWGKFDLNLINSIEICNEYKIESRASVLLRQNRRPVLCCFYRSGFD